VLADDGARSTGSQGRASGSLRSRRTSGGPPSRSTRAWTSRSRTIAEGRDGHSIPTAATSRALSPSPPSASQGKASVSWDGVKEGDSSSTPSSRRRTLHHICLSSPTRGRYTGSRYFSFRDGPTAKASIKNSVSQAREDPDRHRDERLPGTLPLLGDAKGYVKKTSPRLHNTPSRERAIISNSPRTTRWSCLTA